MALWHLRWVSPIQTTWVGSEEVAVLQRKVGKLFEKMNAGKVQTMAVP